MIFAHILPRMAVAPEHGPQELLKDMQKLGLIPTCDGGPALNHAQGEVERLGGAQKLWRIRRCVAAQPTESAVQALGGLKLGPVEG